MAIRVMTDPPHILVVTVDPEDLDVIDCTVECPGVTDECREYRDCVADDAERAALVRADDDGLPTVAHGQRHLMIDGMWMAETDFCYVQGHDGLPDEVVDRFPPGRHPIEHDVGDGTELFVFALDD